MINVINDNANLSTHLESMQKLKCKDASGRIFRTRSYRDKALEFADSLRHSTFVQYIPSISKLFVLSRVFEVEAVGALETIDDDEDAKCWEV